jgi:secernin
MCDTIIATSEATKDGVTIFGKNSDREPNEAHHVVTHSSADHAPGSLVHCTYIAIPQVRHTFATLLAKPFWIWGAEMGANEHNLVIGNEALFTRVPYLKKGLLGMDLLRLALERAATAREGLNVITELLTEFGQGGNAGLDHPSYYHNSFILADPHDAWLLETAGSFWAAKRIKGIFSISNGITIGKDWDLASPDLVQNAIKNGWCNKESEFHFAQCYSDFLMTRFSDCRKRQTRSLELLEEKQGQITVETMMSALRDHGQANGSQRAADESLGGADICMHAGFGPVRISQTTGSMVSYLEPKKSLHFITGTAAPCTGIFKPVWLDAFSPEKSPSLNAILGSTPNKIFNPDTLFWRHEILHRTTLRNHESLIQTFASDRNELEHEFVADAFKARNENIDFRGALTTNCLSRADAAEKEWLKRVRNAAPHENWLHAAAWARFNQGAKMPPEFYRDVSARNV